MLLSSSSFSSTNLQELAFLYRMKERDQITDRLRAQFRQTAMDYLFDFPPKVSVIFDEGQTSEEAIKAVDEFFEEEEKTDLPPIYQVAKLNTLKEKLIAKINSLPQETITNNVIDEITAMCEQVISDGMAQLDVQQGMIKEETIAYQRACESYFGAYFIRQKKEPEKFDQLRASGKLYCPPNGRHTWQDNLQWLVERFHKGAIFVVMSDLTEQSKHRSNQELGSGFFREVAVCYKVGYRFEKKNEEIIMRHPAVALLKNLKVKNADMEVKEMELHFDSAIQDYNRLKMSIEESTTKGKKRERSPSPHSAVFTPSFTFSKEKELKQQKTQASIHSQKEELKLAKLDK